MVSQMMLEDAEDLARRGVVLTPREVVRLNAYGLRAERGAVATALFTVRRACICDDITFYEPTLGHHKWLADAERVLDLNHNETWCYTRAFWLCTRDADDLPPTDRPKALGVAIVSWAKKHLRTKTLREIRACMEYAERGSDPSSGERGPTRPDDEDTAADESLQNQDWCSKIGVVREGQSLGLGIPLYDAMRMTHAELRAVVDRAVHIKSGDSKSERQSAVADYQMILDEIARAHGVEV